MEVPMEITYRGLDKIDFIDDLIRRKAGKLDQVAPHIISCKVTVEQDQKRQRTGSPFKVRLELTLPPGHEMVIRRTSAGSDIHNDLAKIVRDGFEAARRKLKKIAEVQKGKTKSHPEQQTEALVAKLFPEQGYGFLSTIDGREIYFHQNALVNEDFDDLKIGTGVNYNLVRGPEGLQASSVRVVDGRGAKIE